MQETDEIKQLFFQEIPEIATGIVQIKAIARKPGVLTKVAVQRQVSDVDAVRACTGPGGTRIRRIVERLGGERTDVFLWHDTPEKLIANALQPAKVEKVTL